MSGPSVERRVFQASDGRWLGTESGVQTGGGTKTMHFRTKKEAAEWVGALDKAARAADAADSGNVRASITLLEQLRRSAVDEHDLETLKSVFAIGKRLPAAARAETTRLDALALIDAIKQNIRYVRAHPSPVAPRAKPPTPPTPPTASPRRPETGYEFAAPSYIERSRAKRTTAVKIRSRTVVALGAGVAMVVGVVAIAAHPHGSDNVTKPSRLRSAAAACPDPASCKTIADSRSQLRRQAQIRARKVRAVRAQALARKKARTQVLARKTAHALAMKRRASARKRAGRISTPAPAASAPAAPTPAADYHSEARTCDLPSAVDRGNCQVAYETCSTDPSYTIGPNDGGGRADSLAVSYANGTFGSSSNLAWQGGYGGCYGALLEQYDHLVSG